MVAQFLVWEVISQSMCDTAFSAATVTKMTLNPEFGNREKSRKYYTTVGAEEVELNEQSNDKALQRGLWDWTINELAIGDENKTF